jgi:hypothetical protein
MICAFAFQFSELVAQFLDLDKNLKRNFREETITDLFLAGLINLRSLGIFVDFSDEPKTGGDLELWFLSSDLNRSMTFVIQAKRLFCEAKDPLHYSYKHLDHGVSKFLQMSQLLNAKDASGNPMYPLYFFYNPKRAVDELKMPVEGVNVADGNQINKITHLAGVRRPKQVRHIMSLFHPLSDLLCAIIPVTSASSSLRNRPYGIFPWPIGAGILPDGLTLQIDEPEAILSELKLKFDRDWDGEHSGPKIRKSVPPEILRLVKSEPREVDGDLTSDRVANRKRLIFVSSKGLE